MAILGIILIIYSSVLFLSLHYTLYDELDDELLLKVQEIGNTISAYLDVLGDDEKSFIFVLKRTIKLEGEHANQNKIVEYENQWLQKVDKFNLREDYVNFLGPKREIIVSSGNIPTGIIAMFLKLPKIESEREPLFRNIKFENRNLRLISIPFTYKGKGDYILQVGTSLKPIMQLLRIRLIHIAISIPLVLIFASFIGQLFAVRMLKPVKEITETAKNITYKDLSARVKTEHVDEEMRYLVDAFNDMISRLEKSFKYIIDFSSHVAHELKTPLAIIRGESELTLRRERSPLEYIKAIKINLEETERMLRTIEDLLLLTRLDYQPNVFKFNQFDLTDFFKDINEQAQILASPKNITVNIDMPKERIPINADTLRLRRLFFNLITNAIKFTPQKGKVDIAIRREEKKATISISDTGIGIATEDLPNIFNRFFRVDRDEEDIESGSGLGLSIALSIAKIHRGNIQVKSELGKGSTFTVTLPLV